jgi:hypothetical protein
MTITVNWFDTSMGLSNKLGYIAQDYLSLWKATH